MIKINAKKILVIIVTMFLFIPEVYGAKVKLEYVYYDDVINGNYSVSKRIGSESSDFIRILINEGEDVPGYCIDVGQTIVNNEYIEVHNQSLEEYINSSLNNSVKAKELSKKINEYIYFGYNLNDDKKKSQNYYAATQILIWNLLYKNGYRTSHYANDVTFVYGNQTADFSDEINQINNSINEYYKTPSMCDINEKLEVAVGETLTYTDDNNVLEKYELNCSDNIKCEKEGNKLKVTAISDGSEQKISFTKAGVGKGTTVYKSGDYQAVAINNGKLDPVSCEFGVNVYKNVQTGDFKIILSVGILVVSIIASYIIFNTRIKRNVQ